MKIPAFALAALFLSSPAHARSWTRIICQATCLAHENLCGSDSKVPRYKTEQMTASGWHREEAWGYLTSRCAQFKQDAKLSLGELVNEYGVTQGGGGACFNIKPATIVNSCVGELAAAAPKIERGSAPKTFAAAAAIPPADFGALLDGAFSKTTPRR